MLLRGHTEVGSAGGKGCLQGRQPRLVYTSPVPDLATTIEPRYFCRRYAGQSFSMQQLLTVLHIH
jgi:hypothetical protein